MYRRRDEYTEPNKAAGAMTGVAEYPQIEVCDTIRISGDWSDSPIVARILQQEIER